MHAKFAVTVHLFFIRRNRILLSRRFQTGYMDGYYSVPAGHLDGSEPLRMAAAREALEEIGVRIKPIDMDFGGVFHRSEGDERVDFFLLIRKWTGQPMNAEPGKCDDLLWTKLDELPENTIPYIRKAIENLSSGIFFEEYGWN